MKRIRLNSRYGEYNALEQIEGNKYVLRTRNSFRAGNINGNLFIDPSGGPLMTKGTIIDSENKVKEVIEEDKKYYVILEQ